MRQDRLVTTYVALLRGINVGRNQRISMADLRSILTGLGHTEVRTHLQSGNAVFASTQRKPAKIAGDIEAALTRELGLSVRCIVLTAAELKAVAEQNPIPGGVADGSRFLVTFLSEPPDPAFLTQYTDGQFTPEQFGAGERAMYFWCPQGLNDSPMLKAMADKRKDVVATARNWNTVTKLLGIAESG
jgi:uncharacterized protein (DUF1697 family)